MVADIVICLLHLWLVDGVCTGLQWFGGYIDTNKDQPGVLLVDPDPVGISPGYSLALGPLRGLLGCLFLRDRCRVVHAVVV